MTDARETIAEILRDGAHEYDTTGEGPSDVDTADAILAALSRADLAPKVKSLVWVAEVQVISKFKSDDYLVSDLSHYERGFFLYHHGRAIEPHESNTLDAAKAAAQAHHDALILSALVAQGEE